MVETILQQRIWTALTDHTLCMVTTIVDGRIRTRPMSGQVDRANHRILFITHSHTGPVEEAAQTDEVSIALSDEKHNFYAAIACHAERIDDPALIRRIWNPLIGAWFPNGPNDPDVTVLALYPVSAEVWDGPSSAVVIAFKLATARILGRAPALSINTTIDMR